MWIDNDRIMEILDVANKGQTQFPCVCPICKQNAAHIYIHRHDDSHCGIWTWCSDCGSYSHMSGEAPTWWKNPTFVDANQLCSEPGYLDEASNQIDAWVNSIAPAENTFSEKSLIMENKFSVKSLVDFQGIPAGTVGTLVVQDDFRTVTINFINEEGEKINLEIQPEKVTSVFEVIQ